MPFAATAYIGYQTTAAVMTAAIADAALIAAGLSAYSSVQQGKFAQQTAEYEAKVYQQEAESIKAGAEYETREMRREKRQLLASQLVAQAKGGIVPGAGTPLELRSKTAADIERDILLTQFGYGLAESQALSRAGMAKVYGKTQRRASLWQAGITLATGGAQALAYKYRI